MKKILTLLLASLLLVSLFAGCTGDPDNETIPEPSTPTGSAPNDTSTQNSPPPGNSGTGDTGSTGEASVETLHIVLSIPLASSAYWTGVAYGVQTAVDEINAATPGAIQYNFFDPGNFELETQLKNIENALALGVDGMVVAPNDVNGTVPAIEMAYAQGMPIFTVDVYANTDKVLIGYCTFNENAGASNAHKMAELIKEKNGDYVGKVAMILGRANISSHIARVKGFKDTMAANYPNIEIIFEQFIEKNEDSLQKAEDALVMNPKIDGFFGTGDTVANLICQAIDQQNRFKPIGDPDRIIVVGFDGNDEGVTNIRNGRQDATIAQNPIEMGKLTLRALYNYLRDGSLPIAPGSGGGEFGNLIEVPHFPLDYKNVDSPEAEFFLWSQEVKGAEIRLD